MSFNLDVVVGTWNVNSQDPLEHVRSIHGESYDGYSSSFSPNSSTDVYEEAAMYYRTEDNEYRPRSEVANDIEKWLKLDTKQADIYAIGFQEIEMTGKALITEQTEMKARWEHMLRYVFSKPQQEGYTQIAIHQLVGICIVLYVKRRHLTHLDNVRSCIIREGFSGVLGNKGSAAVRFDLYGMGLCFINVCSLVIYCCS
jgi:hypothetical protein